MLIFLPAFYQIKDAIDFKKAEAFQGLLNWLILYQKNILQVFFNILKKKNQIPIPFFIERGHLKSAFCGKGGWGGFHEKSYEKF